MAKIKTNADVFFKVLNFVFLAILCTGIWQFWIGYHNHDLAWNAKSGMLDSYKGKEVDMNQLYDIGLLQMITGLILSIIGALMIGYFNE